MKLDSIKDINEFIKNNDLVLLYIYSDGCSVCHGLFPMIGQILKKYDKIALGLVNVDSIPEIAGEFSIFTVPVIITYVYQKETIRQGRFINTKSLDDSINRYYNSIFNIKK